MRQYCVVNMITRSSRKAALLFVALLPSSFIATGEEKEEPRARNAPWVESHEASYCDVGGELIGEKVTETRHAELSAKALPKSRFTLLKTQEEWERFIERFARIDKKSGKPEFLSGAGFLADPKRTDFSPNFDSEAVLILSADKTHKEGIGAFMDIEVFEDEDRLRTFVFFASQSPKPVVVGDAPEEVLAGHLYMVSVPRKLTDRPIDIRIARQSWGRVCSMFSPPIANSDAAEGQPTNRAEQGGDAKRGERR